MDIRHPLNNIEKNDAHQGGTETIVVIQPSAEVKVEMIQLFEDKPDVTVDMSQLLEPSYVSSDVLHDGPLQLMINDEESGEIASEEDDADAYDSCCAFARPFRPLLYLGPVAVAVTEAADVGRSLYKGNYKSYWIIGTASGAAFTSSIGLTGETTRHNFDQTCDTIKRRALPVDWPVLSGCKEGTAIALSILPALFAPVSEGMQAYYFVDALPAEYQFDKSINLIFWAVVSGSIAGFAGLTTILTESAEMYKVIRERLAGQNAPYTNRLSKIASPILGGALGVLDSLQKSMQSYIAIKTIFNVESITGRIMIGVPSLVNAIPFFCFSGMYSINSLDAFFGAKKAYEPKKIIAMTCSVYIALYLAFVKRALNISFYKDVTDDFGVDLKQVPWQIYESLSWAMFAQETIQATATLYSPMYNLIDGVTNKVQRGFSCMHGFFCPPASSDIGDDIQPLLDDELNKDLEDLPEELPKELLEELPEDTIIQIENELFKQPELRLSSSTDTLFGREMNSLIDKEEINPDEAYPEKSARCVIF